MNKLLAKLEDLEFSTREYFLMGVILFLAGVLIGMAASPKGEKTIGSHNGNNCGNSNNSGSFNDESHSSSSKG